MAAVTGENRAGPGALNSRHVLMVPAAALLAFACAVFAEMVATGDLTPPLEAPDAPIALVLAGALLIAPLLETGLLAALAWVVARFKRLSGRQGLVVFALLAAAMGWALHGWGLAGAGRAFGFALLAAVFWLYRARRGYWAGAGAALVAHIIWNALAVGLVYAAG